MQIHFAFILHEAEMELKMGVRCGVDIIETERIRKSMENHGESFIERIFTKQEIEYCEQKKAAKFQSYAARFAAKEAVSKAFGTGIRESLGWKDIEVLNDELGKPEIVLGQEAKALFVALGGISLSLSLSHCKDYAVAYVVMEVNNHTIP